MRRFFPGGIAFLLILTGHFAAAGEIATYTDGDFRRISAMTAKILERNHYSGSKINAAMSNRIFDSYFDMLDPGRILFTQNDISGFSSFRDDLGMRLLRGDCDFAFAVYDLYRVRYREFRKFTRNMLNCKIDFTIDETVPARMDKQPRPADEKAMHDCWRKRIKNDLLLYQMIDRAAAEETTDKKENKDEKPAPAIKKKTPSERILQRQRDIGNDIEKRDKIDILGLLLDAMARSFGAHSDYQAPKLSEDFEINMSLSLSGIGATLTSEDGYIKIVELVPGGPAALCGKIKINDRIVYVTQENGDTTDLIDMPVSKAVQFIRGEKGTKVTLGILSGESSSPRQVVIVRDKISLSAGAAKGEVRDVLLENGKNKAKVGVITLPGFYMDFEAVMRGDKNARRASLDVLQILKDFEKQQVDSIVIDLRKNGGGSLPDAIVLSGLFLAGDPVVQVRGGNELEVEHDPDPAMAYRGPMVVLTSKFSASAAEIFTGALSDNKRAVIVGDSRTFGKGTVLRVESLDRYNRWFGKEQPAGALTFEIAMFYRPSGGSVQQLGIAPDIQLPSFTGEMEVGEMFLDNHLPWDSIKRVDTGIFDPELDKKIAELKKRSEARQAADPRFEVLKRQISQFRNIRNRKEISLNAQTRWAEYIREKKVADEIEALENNSSLSNSDRKDSDLNLEEAVNIAADLFILSKKP
ncbi:MAG: carboxy terminal-processing peptidase [Lentisphaeria bacterium]|nr:carboxy terminal-processing peptidase [Lentisphaeria bacterium]